jgi:hypothetical protein
MEYIVCKNAKKKVDLEKIILSFNKVYYTLLSLMRFYFPLGLRSEGGMPHLRNNKKK